MHSWQNRESSPALPVPLRSCNPIGYQIPRQDQWHCLIQTLLMMPSSSLVSSTCMHLFSTFSSTVQIRRLHSEQAGSERSGIHQRRLARVAATPVSKQCHGSWFRHIRKRSRKHLLFSWPSAGSRDGTAEIKKKVLGRMNRTSRENNPGVVQLILNRAGRELTTCASNVGVLWLVRIS